MRLNAHICSIVQRRSSPNVHHPNPFFTFHSNLPSYGEGLGVGPFYGIRPTSRQLLLWIHSLKVRRGEPQLPAYGMTVYHATRPCIRTSQQLTRQRDITRFQCPAHSRAADVFAFQLLRQHHLYPYLAPICLVLEESLGAGEGPPKPMVITDDQHAHPQLFLQHLLHELLGRERRHLHIEGQDIDVIDACSPEQCHLLLGGRQQRRHSSGREHRPRVAVEGDEQRLHTTPQCLIPHLPDEALMAAMHAIKEADGTNVIH